MELLPIEVLHCGNR